MPYKDPEAQREYQREWIAARRAEWFEGKVCIDCKSTEDLELDHVDPTQKVSHNVWSWSKKRREAELAKCVPRCHDCHLRKTVVEKSIAVHGSETMYSAYKCRCPECRAARARNKRATRLKRKLAGLPYQ